jgi:DNA-binding NtrC family response regulator
MKIGSPVVLVVADDLIWQSRLREAVERAGAAPIVARSAAEAEGSLTASLGLRGIIVDMTARNYDALEVVRSAASSGHKVLAVSQHEDAELRRNALDAGARRVFSYSKLFKDGPNVVKSLIDGSL